MWLMPVGLILGGLAILWFTSRGSRGVRDVDRGWVSERWLAEHRADSR
jgi:hypothetical protein